jgi:hypothetical protein
MGIAVLNKNAEIPVIKDLIIGQPEGMPEDMFSSVRSVAVDAKGAIYS